MMKPARETSPSGLQITEEAVGVLKEAPPAVLGVYYIGALPFVAGAVTFWAAMLQSAHAETMLPVSALGMAALFVWMKTWQARYCHLLMARLHDEAPAPLTAARWLRSASVQALIQMTGFFTLPLAVVLAFPFSWVYATYQNAVALDDGAAVSARELFDRATKQAVLWPAQNHVVIGLLSPFLLLLLAGVYLALLPVTESLSPVLLGGVAYLYAALLSLALVPLAPVAVIIAINLGSGLLFGAQLLHSLLGLETLLSQTSSAAQNSTFIAIVCALTYLVLDPALKAAYVLRCFYGQSRRNGEDLRIALRRLRTLPGWVVVMATVAVLSAIAAPASAQTEPSMQPVARPNAVEARQLDQALDQELRQPRYTWRMPRPEGDPNQEGYMVHAVRAISERIRGALKYVSDAIKRFFDWLLDRDPLVHEKHSARSLDSIKDILRGGLVLLTMALLGAIVLLLFRMWMQRRTKAPAPAAAAAAPVPDIADERTSADQLPEERWLDLARALLEEGKHRLAIRALFLAMLARLARRDLIRIARHKSNREYGVELTRHAHTHPELLPAFLRGAEIYESVWYGEHEAGPEGYEAVHACHEQAGG